MLDAEERRGERRRTHKSWRMWKGYPDSGHSINTNKRMKSEISVLLQEDPVLSSLPISVVEVCLDWVFPHLSER